MSSNITYLLPIGALIVAGIILIPILDDSSDGIIDDASARTYLIQNNAGSNASGVLSITNGTNGLWFNQTTGNILANNTMYALNIGSSELVFNAGVEQAGDPIRIKGIVGGNGITVEEEGFDLQINATATSENTACVDSGSGVGLCNGGNVNIKSLIGGTGVTVTDTTGDLTLASQCNNTGTGEAICESSNNINSLIAGTGISIADTTGDLTITNTVTGSKLIAQKSIEVYQSITKTNLPVTYTDIYVTAFEEEELNAQIYTQNVTYFAIIFSYDFVGAGTDRCRWAEASNNTNVFHETPTFGTDQRNYFSGFFANPAWTDFPSTSIPIELEQQCLSSNGTNDPIAKGYVVISK